MQPSYRIEVDPKIGLIKLSFIGHWDHSTLEAYKTNLAEKLSELRTAGVRPGSYLTFVDLSRQAAQSKTIAEGFAAVISDHSPLSRKVAVVLSGSTLHGIQVKRISGRAERQFFSNESEAMEWLLGNSLQS